MEKQKEKPRQLFLKTIRSQLLLTYGIMVAIFVVSIMTSYGVQGRIDEAQALSLMLGAFGPTTITYVGVFIIDNRFATEDKTTASWLIVYIATLSLFYAAFESIKIATTNDTFTVVDGAASDAAVSSISSSGLLIIRLMALISMAIAVISIIHILRVANRGKEIPAQDGHKVADGSICAKRRVLW